jgi:hypothetical protein
MEGRSSSKPGYSFFVCVLFQRINRLSSRKNRHKKEPSIEEDAELMELLKKPALKAAWDLLKQMDERQIDVAYSQLEALMRLQDK